MISASFTDETQLGRFELLVAAHAGFQLRPRERETLRRALERRVAVLNLQHADDYYSLLRAGHKEAEREWEQLVACLTNNESYFFRDKGQVALLRERILPELIARNQNQRTLRIWSAGCSTGEEPYSLAMLVDELLLKGDTFSGPRWEITILGTDIDQRALQQAREGCYGSWSFRNVEPALRERFFCRDGDCWKVRDSSRALVTFGQCNLVGDYFPSSTLAIHDMDLIVCRNVFIYLEHDAIASVLDKFARTLRDGGYLMTGHNETFGQVVEPLQVRTFPGSAIYQRVGTVPDNVASPVLDRPTVRETATLPFIAGRGHAPASGNPAKRPTALRVDRSAKAPMPPIAHDADGSDLLLKAYALANDGLYAEAASCCDRLIEKFPFKSEPYEVLAFIAQEQKQYEEAKILLKKALYLAPTSPNAYLELGALYGGEGDVARARTMHVAALDLIQKMPPDASVGLTGGSTAQDWRRHLEQLLQEEE